MSGVFDRDVSVFLTEREHVAGRLVMLKRVGWTRRGDEGRPGRDATARDHEELVTPESRPRVVSRVGRGLYALAPLVDYQSPNRRDVFFP
jgi:hypothetical protein